MDNAAAREAPGPALQAMLRRRSSSKVDDTAPTHEELLALVAGAARVADHSSMRPWRLIELRGDDRERLGRALHKAAGEKGVSTKPLRAPLLVAVVASIRKSEKVPAWEQEAVAAGVAHMLSLALDEAGYGVMWRTGHTTRSKAVAKAHGLEAHERLLGWLYVGGKPERSRPERPRTVDAERMLSRMPQDTRVERDSALAPTEKQQEKQQAKHAKKQAKKQAKQQAKKARNKAKKLAKKAKQAG